MGGSGNGSNLAATIVAVLTGPGRGPYTPASQQVQAVLSGHLLSTERKRTSRAEHVDSLWTPIIVLSGTSKPRRVESLGLQVFHDPHPPVMHTARQRQST